MQTNGGRGSESRGLFLCRPNVLQISNWKHNNRSYAFTFVSYRSLAWSTRSWTHEEYCQFRIRFRTWRIKTCHVKHLKANLLAFFTARGGCAEVGKQRILTGMLAATHHQAGLEKPAASAPEDMRFWDVWFSLSFCWVQHGEAFMLNQAVYVFMSLSWRRTLQCQNKRKRQRPCPQSMRSVYKTQ